MKKLTILLAAAGLSLSACGGLKAGDNDASLNTDLGNDQASGDLAANSDASIGNAGDLSGNGAVPADEGGMTAANTGAAANTQ